MNRLLALVGCLVLVVCATRAPRAAAPSETGRGLIKGRIRLAGKPPGNPVIRMAADPMCTRINAGKRVIQEAVVATRDGGLANVFVKLQGSFPKTAVPTEPVTIDQRGCVYTPRVIGVRLGQTLQVRNGDELLHNVHGLSVRDNGFNVSEPKAGMVQKFPMKSEEVMLKLKCDIHSWMTAFVGVVSHPYFAVSGASGTFQIDNVPPGTYSLDTWHERYGRLTQTVRVKAGAPTTIDFTYTGNEKSPT